MAIKRNNLPYRQEAGVFVTSGYLSSFLKVIMCFQGILNICVSSLCMKRAVIEIRLANIFEVFFSGGVPRWGVVQGRVLTFGPHCTCQMAGGL